MDAARGSHEQRIAEHLAQAVQREARRRLAHAKLSRGAGHAAGAQQCVEHDEQVQVDVRDIHGAYILYTGHRSFQISADEAKSDAGSG